MRQIAHTGYPGGDSWNVLRRLNRQPMARVVETSLMSSGMVGTWINDSAFWIFAKMGGFTEGETVKSWTGLLAVVGVAGFLATILPATTLPMT